MLDSLMWALTVAGLPVLVVPAFLLPRRAAVFLLLAIAAAGILAVEIQFITLRPRPEGPLYVGAYFPSFPSGHAAIAFASATFLALLRRHAFPALAVASLVAVSRVYLGHHHPSDVLMGAILGAATAAISYGAFYRPTSAARPHWAWWLWPQLALCLFAGIGAYLGLTKFGFLQLPYMDKALHFFLFCLLAFFLRAWSPGRMPLVALCLVASIDEAVQALSPIRSFDLIDLAFTLSGITCGAFACSSILSFLEFRRRGEEKEEGWRGRRRDDAVSGGRAGSVGRRIGSAADVLRSRT